MAKRKKPETVCGFCGKNHSMVGPFVEGHGAGSDTPSLICESCIIQAKNALETEKKRVRPISAQINDIPSAKEIYKYLDLHVVGQKQAKKVLAVHVVNHYGRLVDSDVVGSGAEFPIKELSDVQIEKSNILLLGPTGSGKTLLAQTLAKKLDVPFCIGDATSVTEAGYVGEDVENLLLKLLQAADYDVEAAQRGIIYIDEIDKIRKTGGNTSVTRDVSGEGVQQSLLKLIEGTIANVPPQGGRKHPEQQCIKLDTTNILFICGGAFVGIEDIIAKRINAKKSIGFGAGSSVEVEEDRKKLLSHVTHKDIMDFGIIPELAGRLPAITHLEELSEETLVKVLTEPSNALLKQHQKNMFYSKVNLKFSKDAITEIAKQAKELGTGARALRSIVDELMTEIYFNVPKNARGTQSNKSITVTDKVVRGEKVPRFITLKAA